jgi:membrane-associated phospholipid phosphatase
VVALATGWSRWYLGKHTPRQVATGLATSLTLGLWLLVSG